MKRVSRAAMRQIPCLPMNRPDSDWYREWLSNAEHRGGDSLLEITLARVRAAIAAAARGEKVERVP